MNSVEKRTVFTQGYSYIYLPRLGFLCISIFLSFFYQKPVVVHSIHLSQVRKFASAAI